MRRLKALPLIACVILLLFGCGQNGGKAEAITDEQALSAVKNYCYASNPELEKIEDSGEYPVYWEIESSDDEEIVVLFRSYTGAQMRFHITPDSGDTYTTEFVPGITDEEERAEEFNIQDYMEQK